MDRDPAGGNEWAVPGSTAPEAVPPPLGGVGRDGPTPPGAPNGPGAAPSPGPGSPPMTGAGPTGVATAHATASSGSTAAHGPGEVPHLSLRPMTVADVLDGAFAVIKARPLRLMGISAVFVVPVYLLAAYFQRNMLGDQSLSDLWSGNLQDPAVVADSQAGSGNDFWVTMLVFIIPALALVFVAAAIARLVSAWSAGEDLPAGQLLRIVGRSWWPLLASYVMVHFIEGAGSLTCYFGSVVAMAFFSVTAPVIGAEGLGPVAAMKRSAELVAKRFWPVLGINLLIGIAASLLTSALGGMPQLLALWFGLDVAWPLLAAANVIAAVIGTPFVAAATVLLYLDLRIRNEGLDIEVAARETLDGAV